jgi:hypothetical protein
MLLVVRALHAGSAHNLEASKHARGSKVQCSDVIKQAQTSKYKRPPGNKI